MTRKRKVISVNLHKEYLSGKDLVSMYGLTISLSLSLEVMKSFRVRDTKKSVEAFDAADNALSFLSGVGFWWFL